MNRGWIVYILMFVLAVGGLSLILTLGAAAAAPDDLSGEWSIRWDPSRPSMSRGSAPISTMKIAQSGRFLTLRLGDAAPMSFVADRDWKGSRDGRRLDMTLRGDPWTIHLSGEFRKLDPPAID